MTGIAPSDTAAQIAKLQATLRVAPSDVSSLDALGLAYQQRARETGDPTYYTKSDQALHRALRLSPRDLIATSGLGSLALSRHRFGEALILGRRARAISPTTARNYGVIGDALVELGRYREGFKAFDTMAGMRPDVSSYSRIGHARVLLGDVPGALERVQARARRLARPGRDGGLGARRSSARPTSRSAESRRQPRRRAHRAAGLPRLRAGATTRSRWAQPARATSRAAIAAEQEAVNLIPLPQYVATLGDLDRATGTRRRRAGSTR